MTVSRSVVSLFIDSPTLPSFFLHEPKSFSGIYSLFHPCYLSPSSVPYLPPSTAAASISSSLPHSLPATTALPLPAAPTLPATTFSTSPCGSVCPGLAFGPLTGWDWFCGTRKRQGQAGGRPSVSVVTLSSVSWVNRPHSSPSHSFLHAHSTFPHWHGTPLSVNLK